MVLVEPQFLQLALTEPLMPRLRQDPLVRTPTSLLLVLPAGPETQGQAM